MRIRNLMAIAAIVMSLGGGATAATFNFIGTNQTQFLARNDLNLGLNGTTIDFISGDRKSLTNGLFLVGGPAQLTFTFLGAEAGNTNYATVGGSTVFGNRPLTPIYETSGMKQLVEGLVQFSFGTSKPSRRAGEILNDDGAFPASRQFAIGYKKISDKSYYLLFDDIARGDRDFDDMAMRVDLTPVPLPAAGLLLLAGVGGLMAVRRSKARAT